MRLMRARTTRGTAVVRCVTSRSVRSVGFAPPPGGCIRQPDPPSAQVPIPKEMPIRYQAMKNSVQTIAIAMKNGIISAITVPIPDRLS